MSAAPSLKELRLSGQFDTSADADLVAPHLEELRLSFPRVPSWVKPGPALRTLGIHAPEANDTQVEALLAHAPSDLESLHLRGTPVTDALFTMLSRFVKLRYLDLVGTLVTAAALEAVTCQRPSLRFHPRPSKKAAR
jgi:hypothetical protein